MASHVARPNSRHFIEMCFCRFYTIHRIWFGVSDGPEREKEIESESSRDIKSSSSRYHFCTHQTGIRRLVCVRVPSAQNFNYLHTILFHYHWWKSSKFDFIKLKWALNTFRRLFLPSIHSFFFRLVFVLDKDERVSWVALCKSQYQLRCT